MRYFQYSEPMFDEEGEGRFLGYRIITFSEEEILVRYYPYWRATVKKVNPTYFESKSEEELEEEALWDWVAVNWAEEVKEEDI